MELLLVVAMVALLLAIVLPAVRGARERAVRQVCESNLRQLDLAARMYRQDNNDRWPVASERPSLRPDPLQETVYIADLLARCVGDQARVFQCPKDLPGAYPRLPPNTGRSYFQTERSSYWFRPGSAWGEYRSFHNPELEDEPRW